MLKKGSKIYSVLTGSCPKCNEESMYKVQNPYIITKIFDMHERCSHCGFKYKMEPSFFFGAMYISYVVTCAMCIAILPIYTALNFSRDKFLDNAMWYITACAILVILSAPYVAHFSRALWLTIHVKYFKKHSDTHNR